MELQQHIGHPHPLAFNEDRSNQSEGDTSYCNGCREELLGPCFSCADCGFYLHKKCAEAPMQIDDHPFHPHHPLILSSVLLEKSEASCCLCYRWGTGFMYHCSSCEFYLDINCALLPRDTSGKFIKTLHFDHPHPLILVANDNNQLQYHNCYYGGSAWVDNASYACFDCKFFLHKKCAELPIEINHPYHRQHRLVLKFEEDGRACDLCRSLCNYHPRLFYCCSLCNVGIGSGCAWPAPIIEDKSHHEHPFILLLRPSSFNCDACGTQGKGVSYICSTCNIQVHKNCISYRRFIGISLHHHPISRIFSLCIDPYDSRIWDCRICYKKVSMEQGSYYCSRPECNLDSNFVLHVKCAMEEQLLYNVKELENLDEIEELDLLSDKSWDPIIRIVKEIRVGDDVIATQIIHFSHEDNLTLFDEIKDNIHCNGCSLPILYSFYYCSHCDFSLHKACTELRRKTRPWFGIAPLILLGEGIFRCYWCKHDCSGFSYTFDRNYDDTLSICLRCATLPHSFKYQAQGPHQIFYDSKPRGQCSSCGSYRDIEYRCKDCDFALDRRCVTLPRTAWHKCDEHSLTLTYQDYSDYQLQHYCDVCEERRDPKYWFYHCKVCDIAAHPGCVLGEFPFVKPGSKYTSKDHPHPLTFVQKVYYYPECVDCGKPCRDLSLECLEQGCNYIAHWTCLAAKEKDRRFFVSLGDIY